jgi:hypothetical protein
MSNVFTNFLVTFTHSQRLRAAATIVVTTVALGLGGCASTSGYKQPILEYREASAVVVASAKTYIRELNKTERDALIDRYASDREPIKLSDVEKAQAFDENDIQARLGALRALAKYGELLGKLANSDAPERVSVSAQNLGDSLDNLNKTIQRLQDKSVSDAANAPLKSAFSPVFAIVSEIARFAVERKIQQALDKAVIDAQPPINALLKVLRDDLTLAYERKRNALSNARVIVLDGYENERKKPTPDVEQLRKRADEIKVTLTAWEAFPATDPGEGIDALLEAHRALVEYAKSPKKAQDISEFAAQMQAFAARAQRIGEAIRDLRTN